MMKIQHLTLVFLPCLFVGCQDIEGDNEASLVYFFTDQDGSRVPLEGGNQNPSKTKPEAEEKSKGFITRFEPKKEESKASKKKGGFFSFLGKKEEEKLEASTPPAVDPFPAKNTPKAEAERETVVIQTPDISGELLYPSIVEPKAPAKVQEAPLAKAYKILDLGEEKIRVIDRGMGSVEAGDVKKLREQEGR